VREKSKAYNAFLFFRDLGRGRSIVAAYRKFRGETDVRLAGAPIEADKDLTSAPPNWRRWHRTYKWEVRARLWDEVQQQQREEREQVEAEKQAAERRRKRELLDELRFQRIMTMGEMIDRTLASAQPTVAGGQPTLLAKQKTEKESVDGKTTSEVDLARQLEVLCEQERELYSSYFGANGGDEGTAENAVLVGAEFRWVPDSELEQGPEPVEISSIPLSPANSSSTSATPDSRE
jgi:hypothetical protein